MKYTNLFKIISFLIKKLLRDLGDTNWKVFFKKVFTHDIKTKSIILFFSLFFFYYVNLQNVQEKTLFIPLRIEKPEELTLINDVPESINISIRGTRDNIVNLDINKVFALIDIASNKEEGNLVGYPIIRGLPENIVVEGISPSEINLELSSLHRKMIRVEAELTGRISRNYFINDIRVSPRRVEVLAPLDILGDLTTLKTEPIDISGLKSDKEFQVALNKNTHPSIEVEGVDEFTVNLYIQERLQEKSQQGNYPISINLPEYLILDQEYFAERIIYRQASGKKPPSFLDYPNLLFVDTADVVNPGDYTLEIKFNNIIEGIQIVGVEPKFIQITVE